MEEGSSSGAGAPVASPTPFSARLLQFHHSLNMEAIPRTFVTDFVFEHGVPDQKGLRSLCWKLLLDYLPWETSEWESALARHRQMYKQFVDELNVNPYKLMDNGGGAGSGGAGSGNNADATSSSLAPSPSGRSKAAVKKSVANAEDPLSNTSPEWTQYYKDEAIRYEIDKDVRRTYSSMHFFNERVHPKESSLEEIKRRQQAAQAVQAAREQAQSLFAGGGAGASAGAADSAASTSPTSSSTVDADTSANSSSSSTNTTTTATTTSDATSTSLAALALDSTDADLALPTSAPSSSGFAAPSLVYAPDGSLVPSDTVIEEVSKAPPKAEDETHHDVLKRILFIYAKLNPGVRYVQGMNEVLAPMYYVFAHDSSPLFRTHAEPDAFFCFTNVMSHIRDRFIKSLDSSPSGVLAVVKELNMLLHDVDPELWAHLDALKVDPRFYSFRWITLLLSQEFELPEVLRLWDSLFADTNRFQFLLYTCCGMLVCIREQLLAGDFSDALRALQHYQDHRVDFLVILATAHRLKREREAKLKGSSGANSSVGGSDATASVASSSSPAAHALSQPSPQQSQPQQWNSSSSSASSSSTPTQLTALANRFSTLRSSINNFFANK